MSIEEIKKQHDEYIKKVKECIENSGNWEKWGNQQNNTDIWSMLYSDRSRELRELAVK